MYLHHFEANRGLQRTRQKYHDNVLFKGKFILEINFTIRTHITKSTSHELSRHKFGRSGRKCKNWSIIINATLTIVKKVSVSRLHKDEKECSCWLRALPYLIDTPPKGARICEQH